MTLTGGGEEEEEMKASSSGRRGGEVDVRAGQELEQNMHEERASVHHHLCLLLVSWSRQV